MKTGQQALRRNTSNLHHFFYDRHEQSSDWEWLFSFYRTSKIKDLRQIAIAGGFSPPEA